MCAIIDANVAAEVFVEKPQPAGEKFLDWVKAGRGRLVVGGKLLRELESSTEGFRNWASSAVAAGVLYIASESELAARTEEFENHPACKSDDPHVLALAQLSGARLLYSNDQNLQEDFKNQRLIDRPRGKIYSTLRSKNFTSSHRRLLGRTDLCQGISAR